MMHKLILKKKILLIGLAVQMGCSYNPYVYDSAPERKAPSSIAKDGPAENLKGQTSTLRKPRSADQSLLNRGALDLMSKANKQYDSGQYRAAAALAERALRIETKSPLVYHMLAKARYKLGYTSEARNLAVKGKSYAAANSLIYAKFVSLLDEIDNP